MTLLTLAIKSLRHQFQTYAAFFLSSSFAVWLFYLYGSLLYHPGIATGGLQDLLRQMMTAMEWIVGVFSVLFILFAHASFLKARQKELALLATLGMRPGQITRLVCYETGIIGLGAITAGVGVGAVSAKLFFLAIGRALGLPEPFPYHFAWQALGLSYLVFTLIFTAMAIYGALRMRRTDLAELMRDASRPKPAPICSRWLAALCAALLGSGYWLMICTPPEEFQHRLVLTLGSLLAGTYLLFTQGSVALLRWVQHRQKLYWRRTNLVAVSQMVYKVKDNARILFMVSVLSAVVLVTVGIGYAAWRSAEAKGLYQSPIGAMVADQPGSPVPARVEAALAEHGVAVAASARLTGLVGQMTVPGTQPGIPRLITGAVLPVSGFRRWQAALLPGQAEPLTVTAGKAVIVAHEPWGAELSIDTVKVAFGQAQVDLPFDREVRMAAFNQQVPVSAVLVVDDATFADLRDRFGAAPAVELTGYRLADWTQSGAAVAQVEQELGLDPQAAWKGPFTSAYSAVQNYKRGQTLALFLGSFVSLLFFLATGNMLYFKLFTELQADRRQFEALHKVGLQAAEMRRIVSAQTLVMFFAPFAVAVVHAAVFLNKFQVEHEGLWRSVPVAMAAYLALYGCYFLLTRRTYTRALLGPSR